MLILQTGVSPFLALGLGVVLVFGSCFTIAIVFIPVIILAPLVFISKLNDRSIVNAEAKRSLQKQYLQVTYRPIEKIYEHLEDDYCKLFLD